MKIPPIHCWMKVCPHYWVMVLSGCEPVGPWPRWILWLLSEGPRVVHRAFSLKLPFQKNILWIHLWFKSSLIEFVFNSLYSLTNCFDNGSIQPDSSLSVCILIKWITLLYGSHFKSIQLTWSFSMLFAHRDWAFSFTFWTKYRFL